MTEIAIAPQSEQAGDSGFEALGSENQRFLASIEQQFSDARDGVDLAGLEAGLDATVGELGDELGKLSSKFSEGSRRAEDIRDLKGEIAESLSGFATEIADRAQAAGMSSEQTAVLVEAYIAKKTAALLGSMVHTRTESAVQHNRLIPKFMTPTAQKLVDKWGEWTDDTPVDDGVLATKLRETGIFQHLERRVNSRETRDAKLGRVALVVATSGLNGLENLVRSPGARKKAAAMALVGIPIATVSGAVIGTVGAAGALAAVGGTVARSAVRTGMRFGLDNAAGMSKIAERDRQHMQTDLDKMAGVDESTEGYSIEDRLDFVHQATKEIIYKNNTKLMTGVAFGAILGATGNFVGHTAPGFFTQLAERLPASTVHGSTPLTINGPARFVLNTSGTDGLKQQINSVMPEHTETGNSSDVKVATFLSDTDNRLGTKRDSDLTAETSDTNLATYLEAHPKAGIMSKGEGFDRTFRELGIDESHFRGILKDMKDDGTLEKLYAVRYMDKPVVYWDDNANEPRFYMTPDGTMPDDVLRPIIDHAEAKGYLKLTATDADTDTDNRLGTKRDSDLTAETSDTSSGATDTTGDTQTGTDSTKISSAVDTGNFQADTLTSALDKFGVVPKGSYGKAIHDLGPLLSKEYFSDGTPVAYYDRVNNDWRIYEGPDDADWPVTAVEKMSAYLQEHFTKAA